MPEATIALGEHLTTAGALALAIAYWPDQRIELCRLCCSPTTRLAAERQQHVRRGDGNGPGVQDYLLKPAT